MRPCVAATLVAAFSSAAGQSPEAQRRVDAATAGARAAVELAPTDANAYRALAAIYAREKFLRAASGVLTSVVQLAPTDGASYLELGPMLARTGDRSGAAGALRTAEALLPTSAHVQLHLAGVLDGDAEREKAYRRAIDLEPSQSVAYTMLAKLQNRAKRTADAEATLRALVAFDVPAGMQPLCALEHRARRGLPSAQPVPLSTAVCARPSPSADDLLYFADRKLEAAVFFKKAKRVGGAASVGLGSQGAEWTDYVDRHAAAASTAPAKCLRRDCIQGLNEALERAHHGQAAAAVEPPHSAERVRAMLRAAQPTVLRRAAADWGPTARWGAAHLEKVAGDEPLDVTVVTQDGSFEVRRSAR